VDDRRSDAIGDEPQAVLAPARSSSRRFS
jgi:hypothetical protein